MERAAVLNTLVRYATAHASNVLLNSRNELVPVFALASPAEGGKIALHIVGTPWADEEQKHMAGKAVRGLMKQIGCFAYSHVCEAWTAAQTHMPRAGDTPPRERPDRKECVVMFATDGMETIFKLFEIKRGPDGACVELAEDSRVTPETMFTGWMLELLTPQTKH